MNERGLRLQVFILRKMCSIPRKWTFDSKEGFDGDGRFTGSRECAAELDPRLSSEAMIEDTN